VEVGAGQGRGGEVSDAITAADVERVLAALDNEAPVSCSACAGKGRVRGHSFSDPGKTIERDCSVCHGRKILGDKLCADAARLLRAAMEDFERYRQHRPHCRKSTCDETTARRLGIPCTCGLDAARARWVEPLSAQATDTPPTKYTQALKAKWAGMADAAAAHAKAHEEEDELWATPPTDTPLTSGGDERKD
jgi:hypothetical protein